FFQAEDGIRAGHVTGVQTCALPIFTASGADHRFLWSAGPRPTTGIREWILGISAALFAFGGWHMVTYTAGETRDPRKTIPAALRSEERRVGKDGRAGGLAEA